MRLLRARLCGKARVSFIESIENHLAGLPTAALTDDGVEVSLPNRFNRKEAIMNYSGIDLSANNGVVSGIASWLSVP